MARKSSIKLSEELTIKNGGETSKSYNVIKPFKGSFNNNTFNCKVGDTVLLNTDEYFTYQRFLG